MTQRVMMGQIKLLQKVVKSKQLYSSALQCCAMIQRVVVEKLGNDIARALAAPDLRDRLAKHGAEPMSMTQPEFAHFVLTESESASRILKAAGIKPQ